MANAVEQVNAVAIASIEAINGKTDANIQAFNGLEFTGFTYSGITWTTDDVLPVGSNKAIMCGKVGAALYVNGGITNPLSYEHNGSSWASAVCTDGAKHTAGQGGGTQDAAVIYAGHDGSGAGATTDEYNGTSWSTVNSMTAGATYGAGGGEVQSSCFATGGSSYGPDVDGITVTQTYNGTTWTNESVASSGATGSAQNSGGGGLDACLLASGHVWIPAPTATTACNIFSKTAGSWSGVAACSVAVRYSGTCSDGTRVYKIGGYTSDPYSGSTIKDTVESYVDNAWTTESVLPVQTVEAGWGGGGQQSPGGAFQAGGTIWNGSAAVDNSTQYHTAANTV